MRPGTGDRRPGTEAAIAPSATFAAPLAAQTLILSKGELHIELVPAIGGSISAFYSQRERARFDWLRPASPEALRTSNPLRMASFPLLPWCNRIRDGRASFAGREIRVAPNHPADPAARHPLHGIGWLRPWDVVDAAPSRARLEMSFAGDEQWPWRFWASQTFALSADRLDCTLTLENLDTAPMPAGIGHHPYFPHRPGTRLQARTAAMWERDGELMPTELRDDRVVGRLGDGVLLAELDLDNNFIGWDRHARIEWPSSDAVLELTAASPLDYFVLYCPSGFDHFCAEPVSQCTDAFNLRHRRPPAELGGSVLLPGETLSAGWSMKPVWT